MSNPAAMALAEAAETIQSAAREHKRVSEAHRREARRLMGRLAELRRECDRLGIQLEITEAGRRPE